MVCHDPRLIASAVITLRDVEMLRYIRNCCRAGFAHDTNVITPEQQRDWWKANKDHVIAYLYSQAGKPWNMIGYGMLRRDDAGEWWSSVAVLQEQAGHGYGGSITADIIRRCPDGVVHAQARKDNPVACALHRNEDWESWDDGGPLMNFCTRPDIMTRPPSVRKP